MEQVDVRGFLPRTRRHGSIMRFARSAGFRCCIVRGTADFSLAIADKEDHRLVFAKFVLRDVCGTTDECTDERSRITFDLARLGQAEFREYFCQLLGRAPPIPE